MGILPATFLGGITFVSSSGIVARILGDLGRTRDPETKVIVSILVLEDLAMALYLPIMAGGSTLRLAPVAVACVLFLAVAGPLIARFGEPMLERRLSKQT